MIFRFPRCISTPEKIDKTGKWSRSWSYICLSLNNINRKPIDTFLKPFPEGQYLHVSHSITAQFLSDPELTPHQNHIKTARLPTRYCTHIQYKQIFNRILSQPANQITFPFLPKFLSKNSIFIRKFDFLVFSMFFITPVVVWKPVLAIYR